MIRLTDAAVEAAAREIYVYTIVGSDDLPEAAAAREQWRIIWDTHTTPETRAPWLNRATAILTTTLPHLTQE